MRFPFFATSLARLAGGRGIISLAICAGFLAGCEPNVPIILRESNCSVMGDANFVSSGFDFYHYLPSYCPILFTGPVWNDGGMFKQYEGTQSINLSSGVNEGDLVYLDIYQVNGVVRVRQYPFVRWSSQLRASITGDYTSGTRDPVCSGCELLDMAYQRALVYGSFASAEVRLPYRKQYLVNVDGPGSVGQGQYFTLSASVNSLARLPVTYEWFVDGASAGPASQSASSFSDYGTHPGEQQTYQVLVTDAEGARVRSDPFPVFVAGGGGGCEPWMIEC
jgi:hypothetical protein